MRDHTRLILAFAAERHVRALSEEIADQAFPRGTQVQWARGAGWASGVVIASGLGRRLFVADFHTGAAQWISFLRLRSSADPEMDIHQEVARIGRAQAFSFIADEEIDMDPASLGFHGDPHALIRTREVAARLGYGSIKSWYNEAARRRAAGFPTPVRPTRRPTRSCLATNT
jgi:hypothetical protein